MQKRMRASSELISAVILAAVVLAMSLALWSYAQSSTSQLKSQQQIQNLLAESAMKINLLKIYADASNSNYVYQLNYAGSSTIYAMFLGIKGSSFLIDPTASLYTASFADSYANLSNSTQWNNLPAIGVPSNSIMVQPIYTSDTNYYSLDLWLGFTNVNLYRLDFSSLPYILLKVSPSNQYQEVLIFLQKIGDKYWAFAYYYL